MAHETQLSSALSRISTPCACVRVPGEDPTLTSEFAYRYVSALQGGPDDRYKKIVSTCKVILLYSTTKTDSLQDAATMPPAINCSTFPPTTLRILTTLRAITLTHRCNGGSVSFRSRRRPHPPLFCL